MHTSPSNPVILLFIWPPLGESQDSKRFEVDELLRVAMSNLGIGIKSNVRFLHSFPTCRSASLQTGVVALGSQQQNRNTVCKIDSVCLFGYIPIIGIHERAAPSQRPFGMAVFNGGDSREPEVGSARIALLCFVSNTR